MFLESGVGVCCWPSVPDGFIYLSLVLKQRLLTAGKAAASAGVPAQATPRSSQEATSLRSDRSPFSLHFLSALVFALMEVVPLLLPPSDSTTF